MSIVQALVNRITPTEKSYLLRANEDGIAYFAQSVKHEMGDVTAQEAIEIAKQVTASLHNAFDNYVLQGTVVRR
jgi:hypothetical protein